MTNVLCRPATTFDPARGPLHAEHFQIAYATNDIDRALTLFSKRLGVSNWRRLEAALPAGGVIHIELAWLGTTMYELLTASGPGSDIYTDRLPSGRGFRIKHHHLGYRIANERAWQSLMMSAKRHGWSVVQQTDTPGYMRSCFVDAPELGHYLEYLFPEPSALEFFNGVPGQ